MCMLEVATVSGKYLISDRNSYVLDHNSQIFVTITV